MNSIDMVTTPYRGHAAVAAPRAVAAWLFLCCALVFAMVVVGGITRLTHSGLSITEWQPIVGTLPPLSETQWMDVFARYQATPEYRQVNQGITLGAFKNIYWWEYFHRLLGRLIGLVFLLPLVGFVVRRKIPPGYTSRLAGIFILGGLQGAMGWYMVKSGLVDDPHVSQFRLTAHLGIAFLIFGAMFWVGLSLVHPRGVAPAIPMRRFAYLLVGFVFLMALTGGFVAGIRAGLAYNTFPLMNGNLIPADIWVIDPWWRNFFWNMATVQFDHRLFAWSLAFLVPVLWWRLGTTAGMPRRIHVGRHLLLAMLAIQIALGISTLLMAVPLSLAAAHQAGALLVFATALNLAHALSPGSPASA
jgi:heme a synthase